MNDDRENFFRGGVTMPKSVSQLQRERDELRAKLKKAEIEREQNLDTARRLYELLAKLERMTNDRDNERAGREKWRQRARALGRQLWRDTQAGLRLREVEAQGHHFRWQAFCQAWGNVGRQYALDTERDELRAKLERAELRAKATGLLLEELRDGVASFESRLAYAVALADDAGAGSLWQYDGATPHIRPLSRGGTDTLSNTQLACKACNEAKGNDWLPDASREEETP